MKEIEIMLGVVICGGKSTRMGTDKGLIKKEEDTWAVSSANKLLPFCNEVVYSINQNQFHEYSKIIDEEFLIIDNDELEIHGPLAGVLSVHVKFPDSDLMVLACDLPFMQAEILKYLADEKNANPGFDAFCFKHQDGRSEPLCTIYKATGLAQILNLYKNGELQKHSMKYALENIKVRYVSIPDKWVPYFANFNEPG